MRQQKGAYIMGIPQDILSKLPLTDEQKGQLAQLGNAEDIKKFLMDHHIELPGNMGDVVNGIAGKASSIPEGAGSAVKGILDNTDIDEKIMDGLKGFGGLGKK